MRKLAVFNSVTLDGYFTDANSDMSWAHTSERDPEFDAWVGGNAQSGGMLLFGRKTYEMMVSFWPTDMAKQQMPDVADGMNRAAKAVFSRSLDAVSWNNTRLLKGDLVTEVKRLKEASGDDMTIFGSGSIVAQLTEAHLIDAYTLVVCPIVLGKGRTMFEGVTQRPKLKLLSSRAFNNGNEVLSYERIG